MSLKNNIQEFPGFLHGDLLESNYPDPDNTRQLLAQSSWSWSARELLQVPREEATRQCRLPLVNGLISYRTHCREQCSILVMGRRQQHRYHYNLPLDLKWRRKKDLPFRMYGYPQAIMSEWEGGHWRRDSTIWGWTNSECLWSWTGLIQYIPP